MSRTKHDIIYEVPEEIRSDKVSSERFTHDEKTGVENY